MSFENQVIGSRQNDNKQAGNKQLAQSSSMHGKIGAHVGTNKLSPQNSREHTPAGEGQQGNNVEKKNSKKAKSLRTQNIYSDGAITRALQSRGA